MKMNAFGTGLLTGVAIGSAIGVISKRNKKMKYNQNGVFKTVGNLVDNVVNSLS